MNEKRFKELLNEYLDGELSGADLQAFKQALSESVHYRNLLRQYQCLDRMQAAACRRNPRLNFRLLPFGQVCRSGAMLMNASVLFLCVGLFQTEVPLGTTLPSTYFSAPESEKVSPAETVRTEGFSSEMPAPVSAGSLVVSAPRDLSGTIVPAKATSGAVTNVAKAREAGEKVSAATSAQEFEGRIISDEYGFVLL